MIDTAMAYLYSIPPLAASLLAMTVMLWELYIVFGLWHLTAEALDRTAVDEWVWLRLRYAAGWIRHRYIRWRYGALYAAPRLALRGIHSGRCPRTKPRRMAVAKRLTPGK